METEKIPTIPKMEDVRKKAEADVKQAIDQQEKDIINKQISIVNRANETSVLMSVLCEKLGLEPSTTTHQKFVQAFSDLQKASLEAQKELQEKFIATPIPEKRRKTRQLKNV